jgi:hypothetical protein
LLRNVTLFLGNIRPSTLIFLHFLLRNRIFHLHHRDSLLYISYSRTVAPIILSFISHLHLNYPCVGPTRHSLPFFYPPRKPPSHRHRVNARSMTGEGRDGGPAAAAAPPRYQRQRTGPPALSSLELVSANSFAIHGAADRPPPTPPAPISLLRRRLCLLHLPRRGGGGPSLTVRPPPTSSAPPVPPCSRKLAATPPSASSPPRGEDAWGSWRAAARR